MKRSTFIIALIAVLFAACSNLLQPPVKPAALNPTESPAPGMGRLAIRIAPPQAERTLLPDEPVFTRYELHLYYSTAGGASKIIEIAEDNTEVELREGSWRVEVKAFVMFKGAETQAASGSTSITVVNGTTATAAVELKLSQYNESVLRYTVNWEGVNPDTALLRVFGYRSSMADFYPAPGLCRFVNGGGGQYRFHDDTHV